MLEDILMEIKACSSKREAREFIKNGAISINGIKETDNTKIFKDENYLFNKYLVVKRGKKNYYLAEVE